MSNGEPNTIIPPPLTKLDRQTAVEMTIASALRISTTAAEIAGLAEQMAAEVRSLGESCELVADCLTSPGLQ